MKIRRIVISVSLSIMLAACGGTPESKPQTSETAAEASSEAVQRTETETSAAPETTAVPETTAAPETTAVPKSKKETLTISAFNELLAKQPLTVDSKEYVVQDEKYKSLYPDMLQVVLTNHTTADIKNAVIAYVAWDKNNLPVKIKGHMDFKEGTYIKRVAAQDLNLVPDAQWGSDKGYQVEEGNTIAFFEAIVESFETFNGDTWNNPYYDAWCKLYEGVKYNEDLTVEVKIEEDSFEASSNKDEQSGISAADEEALNAEMAKQEFRVISTQYAVQDERYKSLYPDMLRAVVQNDTDKDIKNAVVAFVAWDENNLPVKIKGHIDFSDGEYIAEVSYDDINMIPGSTFGEKSGYEIDENCGIEKFKAIVVSYEAFDGSTWNNPLFRDWKKLYEGVKLQ